MLTGDDDLVQQITRDYWQAKISDKERLMLSYAEKLTKEPFNIKEEDIKTLREAGFSDRDIFDINQVVAYFNYVNRIADGLGVTLEE
ncbi:peroxidase [Anoxybacter fermentans]|nr:peroxidase [Anoxybacter fermentans]